MSDRLNRRAFLAVTGTSVALVGSSGVVAAASEQDRATDADVVAFDEAGPHDVVEVIVGYEDDSARASVASEALEVKRELNLDAVTVHIPKRAAENLARQDHVRYVEPNHTFTVFEPVVEDDDPFISDPPSIPWGVARLNAPAVHADGYTGSGEDVAVIDSGIDPQHLELQTNIGESAFSTAYVECSEYDPEDSIFVDADEALMEGESECADPTDDDHPNFHGTAVAGVVGASSSAGSIRGVAPTPELHPHKVSGVNLVDADAIADAIVGAVWMNHDVINMSLGGPQNEAIEDAIDTALENEMILIAGAGNDPTEDVLFPASHPDVIAVSATNQDDELWDDPTDEETGSSYGPEIDIAAPGADVVVPVKERSVSGNPYVRMSGTSYAAPHVAGAAAILMAIGDTAEQARTRLLDTATDIGLDDEEQGHGLLDVEAAVTDVDGPINGDDDGSDDGGDNGSGGGGPGFTLPAVAAGIGGAALLSKYRKRTD